MLNITDLRLSDLEASDIISEWQSCRDDNDDWRTESAEDEAFYLGNQLTSAQEEYLTNMGMPPEPNNKIRPAVEQTLANVAAGSPEWDVRPKANKKMVNGLAAGVNAILDDIWDKSKGDRHFRQGSKSFIIKGLTFGYAYPDWNADEGLGGVRIKALKPEAMNTPKSTSEPDWSNAPYIIYSDLNDKTALATELPKYKDIIEEASSDVEKDQKSSGNYIGDGVKTAGDESETGENRIRKYVRWQIVMAPHARITNNFSGFSKTYTPEQYQMLVMEPMYHVAVAEGYITEEIVELRRCRETLVLGDQIAYDEVLPINCYPVVAASNEHTGTPYAVGDVRFAKSPQRLLNRTEALLIEHSTSSARSGLLYEDGAIEPEELVKWNFPRAAIRVNEGALRDRKILPLQPTPVSNQLFLEKSRYEHDIEQVFGAYKRQQGDPSGAVGTVGESQIIDEAAARKQNYKVLPLYDMLTQLANISLQWVPHVYTQQRILTITTEMGKTEGITINEPVIGKDGSIERMLDVGAMMADVKVVIGSTRAKSPTARLQRDLTLLNAGIFTRRQVIMNLEGDVDKEALLQELGEIEQLTAALEQAQQSLKKLSGDLQTREREVYHANMRAEIAEATKLTAQALANIRAKEKIESSKQIQETERVMNELRAKMNSINSKSQASNKE